MFLGVYNSMAFVDLLLAAALVMLSTSLGASLVFFFKRAGDSKIPFILSFCAGVMIFASVEMLGQAQDLAGHATAFLGLLLGVACFFVVEAVLPHAHMFVKKRAIEHSNKKALLLAGTITLHNVPEGFAVASAFASSPQLGWLVTLAIAIQDFPEGFVVSAPLSIYGMKRTHSIFWGVFSGFVEMLSAIVGYVFLQYISQATPFALAFSAGAMAYVVFFELLADAFKEKAKHSVALAFILGIVLAFSLSMLLRF